MSSATKSAGFSGSPISHLSDVSAHVSKTKYSQMQSKIADSTKKKNN